MSTTDITRTNVNPWPWSTKLGYSQAQAVEGATRQLLCAGQTSVDGEGNPRHEGDMRAQIGLALDNLERVLAESGMDLGDIARLVIATTDVDEALRNFDVLGARLGAAGASPPQTLIGVTRLALPQLMIEFEATALR